MNFEQSKTKECLARAFAGICQDGARYQFISKSAMSEGYEFIAQELKNIAKNKMAHASVLYQLILDNIEEYKENVNIEAGYPFESYKLETSLKNSAEIEKYEGKNVFAHFAKIAHDEEFFEIEKTLLLICQVNLKNAQKLEFLAEKFDSDTLYQGEKDCLWVCSNCGHSENKKHAWENCPLCNYPKGYIIIQNDT